MHFVHLETTIYFQGNINISLPSNDDVSGKFGKTTLKCSCTIFSAIN